MKYVLYIPRPVSVNHAYDSYRDKKTGKLRRSKSDIVKEFNEIAGPYLNRQTANMTGLPVDYPCHLKLTIQRPTDNRRRDVANYEKVTTDTLVKMGVLKDDCLIEHNEQKWGEPDSNWPEWAACMVEIEPVYNY